MFSCAILSKYVRDNIAQENYLCNVGPELSDIIFWKNNQNLHGPILHRTITHAVLAHSPQPSHCFLSTQLLFSDQVIESNQCYLNTPETTLYTMAQHYLCNVGPGCTVIFSQEYKQYSVVLICLDQHYTRKLPDSPQATLMYNFVWIYLGQHCTRENSLCKLAHAWQPMFMKKMTYTVLCQPCWGNIV